MEQIPATTRSAVEKLCSFLTSEAHSTDDGAKEGAENLFALPSQSAAHIGLDVEISFITSPLAHRVPLYFKVPHEFMTGSICLITPPPQRTFKNQIQDLIENGDHIAGNVRRVIDTKKLSAKVNDAVTNRAFINSYDNFVVYATRQYPKQLCGEFFGRRKRAVWISKKQKLQNALHDASKTVVVPRRGQNAITCCIGHTGLNINEIVENIDSFITQFTKHPQAVSVNRILHISISGTSKKGRRVGLPIFAHQFDFSKDEETHPSKKLKTELSVKE